MTLLFKNTTKFSLAIILCVQAKVAFASESKIEKDPHHKGILSSVNLGLRYSSLLESRGVIFYRDFQIDPVVGLFFFDDRVEFLGDSLGFRDFVAGKWLRLRSRLVSISDNPLFPANESIKAESPDRKDTYEWNNRAEFFIPGYDENYLAEFDIGHSKDFSAHRGNYIDAQAKVKIYRFRVPLVGTLIEPNFFSSLGWGDSAHNSYFYGSDRNSSGFNNFSYGLWFAFPEEADRFYPIIQVRHFQAIGDYKNGQYSKGRNEGWLFSFIATVGVW